MKPTKFAILYTMGNVLSLGSTGFLVGFMNQLKNMFKGTRLVATCVYLGAMIMTLVAACYWKSFGLTVFFHHPIPGAHVVLFVVHTGRKSGGD